MAAALGKTRLAVDVQHRVPPERAERRLHREPCASVALEVCLYHCPTCGTALAAEVLETDADAA